MSRLRELFQMGDIDKEEYIAQRDEIKRKMPVDAPAPDMVEAERTIELLYEFDKIWEAATRPERNRLLSLLIAKMVVEDDRITTV